MNRLQLGSRPGLPTARYAPSRVRAAPDPPRVTVRPALQDTRLTAGPSFLRLRSLRARRGCTAARSRAGRPLRRPAFGPDPGRFAIIACAARRFTSQVGHLARYHRLRFHRPRRRGGLLGPFSRHEKVRTTSDHDHRDYRDSDDQTSSICARLRYFFRRHVLVPFLLMPNLRSSPASSRKALNGRHLLGRYSSQVTLTTYISVSIGGDGRVSICQFGPRTITFFQ